MCTLFFLYFNDEKQKQFNGKTIHHHIFFVECFCRYRNISQPETKYSKSKVPEFTSFETLL